MRVKDKQIGDTIYYKYRINLPKEAIEKLNFLNKNLKVSVESDRIIIYKENKSNPKPKLTNKEKMLQKELMKIININK
jgi:hypothetical protein